MADRPTPPTPPNDGLPTPTPTPARPLRLPSRRASALLAGTMLALGIAIGAAIGPAPEASLAGPSTVIGSVVVPYLNELEQAEEARAAAATPATPTPTPATTRRKRRRKVHKSATPAATPTTTMTTTTSTSTTTAAATLAPTTSVWLIELSGSSFTEALAQPGSAPNIDGKIIPSGALLSSWSGLDASAFADAAALLAGTAASGETPAPTVQTITEPLCPEGTAGAACAAGTPGALSTADSFLEQTLAVITASPGYSSHGLIVVTFATLGAGASAGLTSGSQTATLTSSPPAGVLLISPFAHAGTRPSTTFKPTSPKQSVEALLSR